MAQPVAYNRQYNFTNFQTVNPATPLPANYVDLEFNSVKATLDQLRNNLKLIQRDDTALANASVGVDQLKAEVTIGINPPSPWVTGVPYVVGSSVTTGGKFYRCIVSHTSGVFATDLANGDWTLIIDFNTVAFDFPGTIHGATAKTIPNDGDEFPGTDSAASWALKKITWANFKTTMFAAWGALIGTGTGKSTPVSADSFAMMDSAAGNATKVLTWGNLTATIWIALGPAIAALTGKTTPVGADSVAIQDSAATNATKQVTLTNWWAATFAAFGPLIAAATAKTTPVDTDGLVISDSAASNAPKFLSWANLKTVVFAALGPLIAAAAGKTTPVDGDFILIADSAASNVNKALTWANLKATLRTYFLGAGITSGLTGYLYGMTVSNNGGSPTSKIDVAAGSARDSTDVDFLILAAAITAKDLTVNWAVGSSAGLLDTGAVANNTYHVYAIKRPDTGVVDVIASLSASAPTLPANYTLYRRIGSIIRSGGSILAFVQNGDKFLLAAPVLDVNATNPGTSAVTRTLTVPTGIIVDAFGGVYIGGSSTGKEAAYLSPLSVTDSAPSETAAPLLNAGVFGPASGATAGYWQVLTNTSAQIRSRLTVSDAGAFLRMATYGWYDTRGRT